MVGILAKLVSHGEQGHEERLAIALDAPGEQRLQAHREWHRRAAEVEGEAEGLVVEGRRRVGKIHDHQLGTGLWSDGGADIGRARFPAPR
jgi:hypothetical protein